MYRAIVFTGVLAACGGAAVAGPGPEVVTDIAPVQGIVARVAGDLPPVIVAPGADPHHMQLRPSQVRALARADLLVWMGPGLTPWLGEEARRVNPDLAMLALGGEGDGHDDGQHDHDQDHDHEEGGDIHAEGGHDWLDPMAVGGWGARIAGALGALAPERAEDFARNAGALADEMAALTAELDARLAPLRPLRLVVGHDAYDALADRFGLTIVAALSDGHAAAPGAAHLAELSGLFAAGGADCLVLDSPEADALAAALPGAADLPRARIDPLGGDLPPGPDHYPALMRRLAEALLDCTDPATR